MTARDVEASGFRFLREAQQREEWPWFTEHYEQAPREIIEFLAPDGLSLEDKVVADVGCGDGIIDLGLVAAAKPAQLIGFDLLEVDRELLIEQASEHGVDLDRLPANLDFAVNGLGDLPAPDRAFDAIVSWSTFEHVAEPVTLLREMRRIVRPDGFLFLQIWPLYWSQHGSHLWPWFPEGFAQLDHDDEAIERVLRDRHPDRTSDVDFVLDEFRNLNRITADGLQQALLAAGWEIAKFELMTGATHVRAGHARRPLSELGISGIKLLALPGGR